MGEAGRSRCLIFFPPSLGLQFAAGEPRFSTHMLRAARLAMSSAVADKTAAETPCASGLPLRNGAGRPSSAPGAEGTEPGAAHKMAAHCLRCQAVAEG